MAKYKHRPVTIDAERYAPGMEDGWGVVTEDGAIQFHADTQAAAGLPDGEYDWSGRIIDGEFGWTDVTLIKKDGVVRLADQDEGQDGALSSSVWPIIRGVYNIAHEVGLPLKDAVRLASLNPARAAGIETSVGRFPFTASGRAMSLRREDGFVRVVARADNHLVLGVLHDSLRPGGAAVVQLVGAESLKDGFQSQISVDLDDGTHLLQRREPSEDWAWMEVSWTFVRDGEQRSFDLSHRIYSGRELHEELLTVGFSEVVLHGGFDGRPYDRTANKLVAVARRN